MKKVWGERYIETSFLILLVFSLLIHSTAFFLIYQISKQKPEPPKEPVFIDLQQIPNLPQNLEQQNIRTDRMAEKRLRVPKEKSPNAKDLHDIGKTATTVKNIPQNIPSQASKSQKTLPPTTTKETTPESQKSQTSSLQKDPQTAVEPGSSASSLLRRKPQSEPSTYKQQLFPTPSRLAKLEENYRRKFERDVEEGDTKFLNSDDIQFGSFLRRFENNVYGVWRYPQEAAMKGVEGIVPVRITFNRKGEITNVQQLESSGASILDEEVIRTLKAVGPVGAFPKGYDKEQFHLIAFFQYGGSRRRIR